MGPLVRLFILMIMILLSVAGCAGESSPQMPVSEALRQDAQAYAEAHDVPLDEAIWRLRTQDPTGELQAVLQEKEADVFGGLWIEHEPVYKVIVLVTRDARRIERRYIQGGPLADVAEVREVKWTLEALTAAQAEVMQTLEEVGSRATTGVDVRGNCVTLYVADPAMLLTEIDAAELALPEPICIEVTGPYTEAPPLDLPPGIVFPRQYPPEGLREELTALLIGELIEAEGCLRVGDENMSHLIVWPYDYTVTLGADGTLQIRDGSGAVVAQVGETVRLSGGEVPSVAHHTPMEIPDRCKAPFWLVGSEIRQEE